MNGATSQPEKSSLEARFEGDEYPRVNICGYEAQAYCQWYSANSGLKIGLATTQQWQRAAQGDQHYRYSHL